MAGWIKLHRSITDHWIWTSEPFSKAQAWADLILHANFKPAKIMIRGKLIELERGQQARSELTLSTTWKWDRKKVSRFLKRLESDQMIVQKKSRLTTIISICNYNDFQESGTTDGTTDGTTGSPTRDQLVTTVEEGKKERSKESSTSTSVDQQQVSASKPKQEQLDYDAIMDSYNEICTPIGLTGCRVMTQKREKATLAFWKRNKFTIERWEAYLQTLAANCAWMGETRPKADGQNWQPRKFDFVITDNCYAIVKESRG